MIFFHDNNNRQVFWLAYFLIVVCSSPSLAQGCIGKITYTHPIEFKPKTYFIEKIKTPILVDGKLDDQHWSKAHFSSDFEDIEGEIRATPERRTRVKMLYDDEFLYIGALLEEDHIWHTLKNKDDIMFYDDDFEVFIDANGDGHNYQEFEMNAYNALWDLWMLYPYYIKAGKNYIMEWEAKGMQTAVFLQGSANDPSDIDEYWSVELAIPLRHLGEPKEFWRINFSRVDWLVEIQDSSYVKVKDTAERNWVWSPTGFVNMHKPETWGYLVFDKGSIDPQIELLKWEMWKLYYSIKDYRKLHKSYPANDSCFEIPENIELDLSQFGFDIIGKGKETTWLLNESALITKK